MKHAIPAYPQTQKPKPAKSINLVGDLPSSGPGGNKFSRQHFNELEPAGDIATGSND